LRKLTCDRGEPLIVKGRVKEAAEDESHRHRGGTDRKPSPELAVRRDKKNENKDPASKENQRGPHVIRIIALQTGSRRPIGATNEPITSKDLPTVSFCLANPGFTSDTTKGDRNDGQSCLPPFPQAGEHK
jgi:hypothetical protein